MNPCSEILKNGVFDTIIIDTNKTFSENYTEWLKTSTYEEIKEEQNAGISIAIPIEGLPLNFITDFGKEDYSELRGNVDSGKIRKIDESEQQLIVKKSASQAILDAWVECGKTFGLLDYEDI